MKVYTLFSLILLISFNDSIAQVTQVLEQENPPIVIEEFKASYQKDSQYRREGIRYEVKFSNATADNIVAYSIGFYSFDVFNRSLGRPLDGFSIETVKAGKSTTSAWLQSTYSASLFDKYGTALAYISRVRFEDGTIWEYDSENVLIQLQQIEESLTIEDLESDSDN